MNLKSGDSLVSMDVLSTELADHVDKSEEEGLERLGLLEGLGELGVVHGQRAVHMQLERARGAALHLPLQQLDLELGLQSLLIGEEHFFRARAPEKRKPPGDGESYRTFSLIYPSP